MWTEDRVNGVGVESQLDLSLRDQGRAGTEERGYELASPFSYKTAGQHPGPTWLILGGPKLGKSAH